MIGMTEIQLIVKEKALVKVSILLFSVFHNGFHTLYSCKGMFTKEEVRLNYHDLNHIIILLETHGN